MIEWMEIFSYNNFKDKDYFIKERKQMNRG